MAYAMSSVKRTAGAKGAARAPRRRVARPEREAQLLAIATRRFSEDGYHAVSVDDIAGEAGVTKPIVYAYFGSKEGLFAAAAEAAAERLQAALVASAERWTDPEQRMWHGCLEVFQFIEEHREAWRVLYLPESPGGPFGGPAAKATQAMADLMTTQFQETAASQGVAPAARAHLESMAHAFVHATIGLGRWWMDHPEEPRDLQALRLMNFAWVGLDNLGKGALWAPPPPGADRPKEEQE